MNCDIFRLIGLVYQEFNQNDEAFDAFQNSLVNSKKITYYHGIAKSNEFLGDLFFKNRSFLESYRYYSNSINVFQSILNSIKDPHLKENYKSLFERLPNIINKVDTILEEKSFELPSVEIEKFSRNAKNLCIKVREKNFEEIIAKDCSNNVKKFYSNKEKELNFREEIKQEWFSLLSENCFKKLDEETQDILIRYKINVKKTPDDYESIIQKIAKAIECEIRVKLFEGFYNYWKKNVGVILKPIEDNSLDQGFVWNYNDFKKFLKIGRLPELKSLFFILLTTVSRKSFNIIPAEYTFPFKSFNRFIGPNNIKFIENVIRFFQRKYSCGKGSYYFTEIRNKCSHGGGRFQEKRKKSEISIGKDTFEDIENCLFNEDIHLLKNICSIEL